MRILTVVDYNPQWPLLFEQESQQLRPVLGNTLVRIHHIGSTSVPGLMAKPVIDILLEVTSLAALDRKNSAMVDLGYTARGENGITNRRYFTKGGHQRSHQIHAFVCGDRQIIKHLLFRDYLITHPGVAEQYARIKQTALLLAGNDAQRYSAFKASFIEEHLCQALDKANHW